MPPKTLDLPTVFFVACLGRGADAGEAGDEALYLHQADLPGFPMLDDADGPADVLGDVQRFPEGVAAPQGDDSKEALLLSARFTDSLEDVRDGPVPAEGDDRGESRADLTDERDHASLSEQGLELMAEE